MGDRLLAGNSRYVTSHPGQLSLAIPRWVGVMNTSLGSGWECNRASQTIVVYPPTGSSSTACEREMSNPPTLVLEYGPPLGLYFTFTPSPAYRQTDVVA